MEKIWIFLRRFTDLFILPANRISSLVRPSHLSVGSFTPKILQCLHCWGNKMSPSFAILNSQYLIIWIVTNLSKPSSFPSFTPSAVFFLFLDKAAGCIVSSQSLASLHVQTFFGNYKQPSQPREALSTSSQSVLIFTRLQNRSRCQPWGDFFVLLCGEPTLVLD